MVIYKHNINIAYFNQFHTHKEDFKPTRLPFYFIYEQTEAHLLWVLWKEMMAKHVENIIRNIEKKKEWPLNINYYGKLTSIPVVLTWFEYDTD